MTVLIRPEHLIGNSWTHKMGETNTCPLALALKPMLAELGINNFEVGAYNVYDEKINTLLNIPTTEWDIDIAEDCIQKANEGCLRTYPIVLGETLHFQQITQTYAKEIPSKLEQILSPE